MKRNMDLCREILMKIEQNNRTEMIIDTDIDGYDIEEISYNAELLYNKSFISEFEEYIDGTILVGKLTWEGNDFLDKIRSETVWNKTKAMIKEKGLPLAIDTILAIAPTILEQMIK